MSFNLRVAGAAAALLCLIPGPSAAQTAASSSELDDFMKKVLARREVNRQTLEQYVLDEREQVEVLGPGRLPLYRTKRDFRWYVRDGLHVRSPLRFDGVDVGDEARQRYEEDWSRRERERLERRKEREKERKEETGEPLDPEPPAPAGATPIPTPRFVSEAYFLDFKFEPGNYMLAGREQLEGHQVLRIEYYPKRLFDDANDEEEQKREGRDPERAREGKLTREQQREQEMDERIDRQMNKTALVTLWVDPSEHQIVKYTFDNVWMDFLPGAWLVRVDDLHASMTMGQPFPGVWLPRGLNIQAGVTLANGSFEATYERLFSEYRQADVKTKLRIPKGADSTVETSSNAVQSAISDGNRAPLPDGERRTANGDEEPRGPYAPDAGQETAPQEVVAEIRVHGNAYLPDREVMRLSGIAVGQPLTAEGLAEVERKLKASGRFESVEVRKRFRSLTSTTDVVVVLVVHERPGVTEATPDISVAARPWHRLKSRLMFLPILNYADGYGFTYGGRISTVDLLGIDERLSLPLTWGGTRRAALEFERTYTRGPITVIRSSGGIWQRENPRFEIDDQRVEARGRVERHFAGIVRTGFEASTQSIEFGTIRDPMWTVGADAVLDTRGDPLFPRNAVLLSAGWTGLHVRDRDRINRYTADARGYLGVYRQLVLAGRVQHVAADDTLPPYERLLVGGFDSLRGFDTGEFAGDRSLTASAELRLPITSVLSSAKLGITGFFDAGTAYDFNQRLEDAQWHQGAGAGVFLIAAFVKLNLDVAHGFKTGDTRVHFSSGFSF